MRISVTSPLPTEVLLNFWTLKISYKATSIRIKIKMCIRILSAYFQSMCISNFQPLEKILQ